MGSDQLVIGQGDSIVPSAIGRSKGVGSRVRAGS
jgi:hypothetical protein